MVKNMNEREFVDSLLGYLSIAYLIEREKLLVANNDRLRRENAELIKQVTEMAKLLKQVADEGDLIGEKCQEYLDNFAREIPF